MQKAYEYAVRNGYKFLYQTYLNLNYHAYARQMRRIDIEPMSYTEWRETAGRD